jgi:hypothetical protein
VATLLCEPADRGTRVTGITEVEVGGFFNVGEPILMRMVQRQSQGDFLRSSHNSEWSEGWALGRHILNDHALSDLAFQSDPSEL